MRQTIPPVPRAGLLLALCLISYPPAAGTAATIPPTPAATGAADSPRKTHVLFIGEDLAVEKGQAYQPVVDVDANAVVISPGGKPENLPLGRNTKLQIITSLKMASTSVEVSDLKTERAYTSGADPFQQLSQIVSLASQQYAEADVARSQAMTANAGMMGASIFAAAAASNPDIAGEAAATLGQAQQAAATASAAVTEAYQNPSQSYDIGAEANKQGGGHSYDAIRFSFQVTSEKDLAKPYYVVIALLREPGQGGQLRRWVHVESLRPMTAGVPRKVTVYQGGLPPGYSLENFEVHLYDRGGELATNLSRKRVLLTDDEALDFEVIEYIGANTGRTLPAVPATFTRDLRPSLTPAELGQTCYVRVARDGRVAMVFNDAAGQQPLRDPALASALQMLRFKPALHAGKPVESTARITLGKLASP